MFLYEAQISGERLQDHWSSRSLILSLLLKVFSFNFYLLILQLVLSHVAAVKVSPYIIHSADYISFWSFEISEHILRNQKSIIDLDSFSRQNI